MECVICCAGIENVGDRCVIPCGHMYHVECLVPWVLVHANCPLCRATCSKDDIVMTIGKKDVKAVIYLDDLVPIQQRPHLELGQRRATVRYDYDEVERSDFLKTFAYILLVVITFILFMKAVIGVNTL
ncbi:RNF115 family protein [Megaselia abdita]